MHRFTTVLIVLLGVLSPVTGGAQTGVPATRTSRDGAQNWPQFRGTQAGVAADDPRLPDTWSATENVAWTIDIPGRSWSSPVVWGDHVFVLTAINAKQPNPTLNAVGTYLARSLGGPMTGADITQPTDEHRWVLYDVDFQTGKIRWERAIHAAVPQQSTHQKNSYASETPVTDGERVYVYLGYARAVRLRHGRQAGLVEADGRAEDAHGLGLGRLARPPRRPPLHRQRQRRAIVHRGVRRAHRQRAVAHRSRGRRLELVDAVRVAERPAHRDRHDRQQEGAVVRHQRQAALGADRHDVDSRRHAVRQPRPAVRQLRLLSRPAAADVRDPAGRHRRHLAEGRGAEQRLHRVVASDAGVGLPVAARRRRPVLHADGSRAS